MRWRLAVLAEIPNSPVQNVAQLWYPYAVQACAWCSCSSDSPITQLAVPLFVHPITVPHLVIVVKLDEPPKATSGRCTLFPLGLAR